MKTITAAEANRQFSSVLRTVAQGQTVLVTSRGKPVATIAPAHLDAALAAREQARQRLIDHLRQVRPTGVPRDWTRDELYER
jgi:prevent-host-death family protein